ncbi:nitrate reductase molybdenum cofactor assembly chaperone [Paraburkholderia silvatlantica]|uniref:Nitrate reductase delta subunit n=1 Tax=Paraburkholderia silvatlantica TaxID=321895 RepID=A0A2U1AG95_9BURK|nr:nitrate reductase molybdenum cofactor assembly chaperone [Paraburkholderia silvatlantica]MBB2928842.1 nitrate reductase delta subunit [Paraburkholderia silvatlantica]PVY35425.1 respiratory nitrate reductase chaperone NarJ [Paraburkholderia silvatlantica]PXW41067.1 respiratory nitrate reductase chaperone NarJ [Paraburkholderia silvatlantica]PYE27533.1 respiratory nitrate reductase chaperone NarJ [Paraburkholderia silvatlantica]TDQ98106.1 respiratory nitrate reductase chaperone NarJ [Paraburk
MFAARPQPMTYRLVASLLEYPDAPLIEAVHELRAMVRSERAFGAEARGKLERFLDYLDSRDLLALQENYVALFDRGRATSLHLFEHVHGESRDRGQAMIDLVQTYEKHGMLLQPGQLPDYLPVFLEYLSILETSEARALLGETVAILQSITQELSRRNSHYAYVTGALLPLAGAGGTDLPEAAHDDDAGKPHDKEHLRALDAAWADEPVQFMGAERPAAVPSLAPVAFHPRRASR